MPSPLFSIIVPVYNVEPYLSECLSSIMAQSFTDYELICVDDGSTDSSASILQSWKPRFSNMTIISRCNGGLSAARNTGLSAATGSYVIFVDSDDAIAPNMLHLLSSIVGDDDIVSFGCRCSNGPEYSPDVVLHLPGNDFFTRYALAHNPISFACVWQRCYRRDFLVKHSLLFREGIIHEDCHFTPRAVLAASMVSSIPDILYYYRIRTGSIMSSLDARSAESLVLIANELSLSLPPGNVVLERMLTQYYQLAFASHLCPDSTLSSFVDWHSYHRVSRHIMRHRINYLLIRFTPGLYRQFMV